MELEIKEISLRFNSFVKSNSYLIGFVFLSAIIFLLNKRSSAVSCFENYLSQLKIGENNATTRLAMENRKTADWNDFLKERFYLRERRAKIQEEVDKQLLVLSSGALTLSITFMKTVFPEPVVATLFFLGLSWLAFCTTIVSVLVSFYFSARNFEKLILASDFEYSEDEDADRKDIVKFDDFIKVANKVAFIAFILGFFLQALFFFGNIKFKS